LLQLQVRPSLNHWQACQLVQLLRLMAWQHISASCLVNQALRQELHAEDWAAVAAG
jgi:hypothetical protein